MSESDARPKIYRFGDFRLDGHTLECGGERTPLTPKALDKLLALVENAGQVVDKETLFERVWPDAFVRVHNGVKTR